jgi:O-antigen/teichoic acid export membrane protein
MTEPDAISDEATGEIAGMARGGALNVGAAIVNQLCLFLITVVMARVLGRAAVGLYAQAFAFLTLLGLLSLSGFRAGLTRFVAVHLADDDAGAVRGALRLGVGITAAASVALGLALFLLAPFLARHVFNEAALAMPLRFAGATLPAAAVTDAVLSATQGFHTMKPYAFIGLIGEPAGRLALSAIAMATGAGLRGVMVALLISNWCAVAAAFVSLRALVVGRVPRRDGPARYLPRQLVGFSAISWMAALASTGLIWADTLLLGAYKGSAAVGVYQVATRVVLLASFVMLPVNAAFAPRIAALYRRGRTDALQRSYAAATGWILRLSLPAFAVCVVFPRELLAIFGHRFVVGASVTIILAGGKLVDSATGPCGLMLNMSGRPGLSLVDNVIALALNIGLNIWLIPRHGIVGSAWAWAVSLAVVNIARVVQVRRVLGMFPFGIGEARALVAALLAAAMALSVRLWTSGFTALAVGGATLGVVYLALVLAFGVTDEDRAVFDALRRRDTLVAP